MVALQEKLRAAQTVGLDSSIFIYLRKITEIEILVLERWLQEHGPTDINSEPQE